MKKIVLGILIALGCLSCTKELQEDTPQANRVTIYARFPQTKVSVDGAGKVFWEEGDKIGVFINGKVVEFTIDEGVGTAVGGFTSDLYQGGLTFDGVAVYPYDESLTLVDNKVSVKLSASGERGKYLPAPMIASLGADGKYTFRNIAALMRVQYENLPSMAEKVRCTASSTISGVFTLANDKESTLTLPSTTGNNVVVAYLPTKRLNNSAYVDIPVPAGTLNSMKVELLDVNGNVLDTHTANNKVFTASVVKPLKPVTLSGDRMKVEWIWDEGSVPAFRSNVPAIDDNDNVYVASSKGAVYKLNSKGQLQWSNQLSGVGGNVETSPSVEPDGSSVYFAGGQDGNGMFYALNNDGSIKWTFNDYPWSGISKNRNFWQSFIGVGKDNVYLPIGTLCGLVAVDKVSGTRVGYGAGNEDGTQGNMPGTGSGCAIGLSGTVSVMSKAGAYTWNKALLDAPKTDGKYALWGYKDLWNGWGEYYYDKQGVIAAKKAQTDVDVIISCAQESKARLDICCYKASLALNNTLQRHDDSNANLKYIWRYQIGSNTNDAAAPAMQDQGGIIMGHENLVVIVPMKYRSGASDKLLSEGGLFSIWVGRGATEGASRCWRVNTGSEYVSGSAAVDNNGNVHFATNAYYYIVKPNTTNQSYTVLAQVHLKNLMVGSGLIGDFEKTGVWSSVKISKTGKIHLNVNIGNSRGVTCCFTYPGVTGPDPTSSWPQKGSDQYNSSNQQI